MADITKFITLNIFTRIHQTMPLRLGDGFKFVKTVFEDQPDKTYDFGLYVNSEGNQVLAKMWTGKVKNLDYYWLQNEAQIYKAIFESISGDEHPLVSLPSYRGVFRCSDSYILVIDYVAEDRPREDLTLDNFLDLQAYLHSLGHSLQSLPQIKFRPLGYYVLSGLVNLLLCIMRDPGYTIQYIRAYTKLFRAIWKCLGEPLVFTHRDIKRENIIMHQGRLYIIDFQLSVFTNRYVEVANTIIHCLEKKRAHTPFTISLMRKAVYI
jgi:serine/threonine protein kinase